MGTSVMVDGDDIEILIDGNWLPAVYCCRVGLGHRVLMMPTALSTAKFWIVNDQEIRENERPNH